MLQELNIRSFALIDELSLTFGRGMNIITGETGSGKSIIIDALGLTLGDRATAVDVIRTGSDKCIVDAIFDLDDAPESVLQYLREQALIENEGSEPLIVSRELNISGKNSARINGRLVPVSVLRQATAGLVDIHGQNEHQTLLAPERHLELLDRWLGERASVAKAQVEFKYAAFRSVKSELASLHESVKTRAQNLDLYRFQKNEIDLANLAIGEDDQLQIERTRLVNSEKLHAMAEASYTSLSENGLDSLNSALTNTERGAQLDPTLDSALEQIRDALSSTEDAARTLRSYKDSIEFDPARIEEIDDRLEIIRGLKRKYAESIDGIISYSAGLADKLNVLEDSEALEKRLSDDLTSAQNAAMTASNNLSIIRKTGAREFAHAVVDQLKDLAMAQCVFDVEITQCELSSNGIDDVAFVVSTNIGEPVKALGKVASGGELSRLMLALKSVLAGAHNVPTLIFDEIDVGVGGRTAQSIALKLLSLSKSAQVFCITHLPQIASIAAAQHISIEKQTIGSRTSVRIASLNSEQRVDEIARMLGSTGNSSVIVEHAKELLQAGTLSK